MKKLLPLLLALVLLFSACNPSEEPTDTSASSVTTSATGEPQLFAKDAPSAPLLRKAGPDVFVPSGTYDHVFGYTLSIGMNRTRVPSGTMVETPTTYIVNVGNKTVLGTYIQDLCYSYRNGYEDWYYVFHDEAGKKEYRVHTSRNEFIVTKEMFDASGNAIYNSDIVLSAFSGEVVSEETIRNHVKNYISEFISADELEMYECFCTTRVLVSKPNSAWSEERDGFYAPTNETEGVEVSVSAYTFQFYKRYQGYLTSDSIVVCLQGNGDIYLLEFCDSGIDWSLYPVDEAVAEEWAMFEIPERLSEEYTLKSYEILPTKRLVYEAGEIKLSCIYRFTLDCADGEIQVDFPVETTFYKPTE